MVDRYNIHTGTNAIPPTMTDDGDWVKYEDHKLIADYLSKRAQDLDEYMPALKNQNQFRAWDKKNKMYLGGVQYIESHGPSTPMSDRWFSRYYFHTILSDNTFEVEQFSGLLDSTTWDQLTEIEKWAWTDLRDKDPADWKGKMIYENDIVYLAGYGRHDVEFPFFQLYDSAQEGDVERILGNVHENPELLND